MAKAAVTQGSLNEALSIQAAYTDLMNFIWSVAPEIAPDLALMMALIGDQTLTPTEIKRRKYFNGTNPTYSLHYLEKEGFIQRSRIGEDRRKNTVTLTRKGREIAHRVAMAFSEEARDAA